MALQITCDGGFVVRGTNETELLSMGREHIATAHPDIVGQIPDDQLLAVAESMA